MIPPRIRGRTAEIEEPIEDAGKFVYEITIWDLNGEKQISEPMLFGPFDTEAIAKEQGYEIARRVCQGMEKQMTGSTSNKYLDLKNGAVMRSWGDVN